MRHEPPANGFLCWDPGTKPEPTRNMVGGGEEGGQWRGRREQIGGGSRAGLGKWQGRGKWRGRRQGCTTHPALPCPGAATAQRGGGGISRPHPRPGRSARLSLATAAAQAPCVAPATGGPVVSAAETVRLRSALLGSGTCCRRGRCASLWVPAPGAVTTPGAGARPRPRPRTTSQSGPAPPLTSPPSPACLPVPQVWERPVSRSPASPHPGLTRLVHLLPCPDPLGPQAHTWKAKG